MSKGAILVVDDESEIREGLELLLTSEGYGVSSAETGESGLGKPGEQPFDLLLLDVSLPDRNGLELLRELRRTAQLTWRARRSRAALSITLPSRGQTMSCLRKWRRP